MKDYHLLLFYSVRIKIDVFELIFTKISVQDMENGEGFAPKFPKKLEKWGWL